MISKQMAEVLVRVDERTATMAEDISELKHVINGNGSPGLKDAVARHDERLKAVEDQGGLDRKEQAALYGSLLLTLGHIISRLVH